ncbi:probable 28S ribosomal protein S26, mitochondrial [Zerene cesonia]|uniref:probable 28S ribosomal protein S26, mitochondrial n=1 Tax=Zerene cesonia TaxID=33412 RepID=UPI0018E52A0A|nr:probable 28S ribosomal protein S26, mitochondrial [Zerene cesonia]
MISQKYLLNRTLPIVIQRAEAHRKPRWLPVAKSKIYRIPKRPEISEDERLELRRLSNNYKTQMRAVKRFYVEDFLREKLTLESATSEMSQRLEAEEWQRCEEINDMWNAQIAAEREERRKKELNEMEQYSLARMEAKDREMKERIAKASAKIKREKELSTTFITRENLEATIDAVLANPTDYNYAIDLSGRKFPGRDTKIEYEDNKKQAQIAN